MQVTYIFFLFFQMQNWETRESSDNQEKMAVYNQIYLI